MAQVSNTDDLPMILFHLCRIIMKAEMNNKEERVKNKIFRKGFALNGFALAKQTSAKKKLHFFIHVIEVYNNKLYFPPIFFLSRSRKRMQNVSNVSITGMLIMYLLAALFGYLTFYGKLKLISETWDFILSLLDIPITFCSILQFCSTIPETHSHE